MKAGRIGGRPAFVLSLVCISGCRAGYPGSEEHRDVRRADGTRDKQRYLGCAGAAFGEYPRLVGWSAGGQQQPGALPKRWRGVVKNA